VEDLKDYLLSTQLYWPLPVSGGFSKSAPVSSVTPGNLLLSLRRLMATPLDANERAQMDEWKTKFDQTRDHWRAAWNRKVSAEFSTRLDSWQNYLNELIENPGRGKRGYPSSVRGRCILTLLQTDLDLKGCGAEQALDGLDAHLRSISAPGPFVWEPEVETAFPPEQFWFLYLSIL
jgi:hypothetical protein